MCPIYDINAYNRLMKIHCIASETNRKNLRIDYRNEKGFIPIYIATCERIKNGGP